MELFEMFFVDEAIGVDLAEARKRARNYIVELIAKGHEDIDTFEDVDDEGNYYVYVGFEALPMED